MKIVWSTDIHLNFCSKSTINKFFRRINKEKPDIFIVCGDIGESIDIVKYLKDISKKINCKTYFVLGNHDFYMSTFSYVKEMIRKEFCYDDKVKFLDCSSPVKLNENSCLIGVGGNADGMYGDFLNSEAQIADMFYIYDFLEISKHDQKIIMKKESKNSSKILHEKMVSAVKSGYNILYVVTHVPPFKEVSLYKDKIANDHFLPYFSNKTLGDMLIDFSKEYEKVKINVLCGHSHYKAHGKFGRNIEVFVQGAFYEQPNFEVLKID